MCASHRPSFLHRCRLQVIPRWTVPGTIVGPIVSSLQQRVWTLFRNRLSLRVRVSVLGESDSGSLMMLLICILFLLLPFYMGLLSPQVVGRYILFLPSEEVSVAEMGHQRKS